MNQPNASPHCPMCDSPRVEVRHDRTAKYRYLRKEHLLEGQEHTVCLACGTSFYQPGQVERNNKRFTAFAHKLIKHIAPWDILALREKYLISQEQACRIFQCGSPTQFSKWERGEVAPTGTAALALREALDNPVYMKKLADQAGEAIDIPGPTETASDYIVPASLSTAGIVTISHALPKDFVVICATHNQHSKPAESNVGQFGWARIVERLRESHNSYTVGSDDVETANLYKNWIKAPVNCPLPPATSPSRRTSRARETSVTPSEKESRR